ncbi:MAG: hypothetical protein K2Q06_04890 [Parvularculaceae bacterium]|nr:hypothetical protein [Parvularculaceae bacterium]
MIKKILPIALQSVFVFGGVAGGIYLKSSGMLGAAPAAAAHAEEADDAAPDDGHGGSDKDKKAKDKKDGHGEADKGGADKTGGVIRFSRQFVVPVIHEDGVNSLLVLDIGISVPPEATQGLYTFELKLRDALLTALLRLSNSGAFDDELLDDKNIDALRTDLLAAAKTVIGDDAKQILILNIARQRS